MTETSSEQEQKKVQPAAETARPQPGIEAPLPEWEGAAPILSLGPGLGSPDGFEQRASDGRQRRSANRQQRVQTMTAMQRQLGNRKVQRFMVQRQAAGGYPAVQREHQSGAVPMQNKAPENSISIDEKGVTTATYNMDFKFKNEKDDPAQTPDGVKPNADLVTTSATVIVTLKVLVTINLPTVPSNLTACQKKRVKDAIDNKLAPHEAAHEAAMKTYDAVVEEDFTLTGIKRSEAPAARRAKGKEIADRLKKEHQTAAQDASDKLDQPPFNVTVDLDCEDEKKPGKKDVEDTGAQPELASGGADQGAAESGEAAA
jgi:hypothetical protein